jgi:hypothetical protein
VAQGDKIAVYFENRESIKMYGVWQMQNVNVTAWWQLYGNYSYHRVATMLTVVTIQLPPC